MMTAQLSPRRVAAVVAFVAALVIAAGPARAESFFEIEEPRVFSIQPRPYRLGHEFQLGLGVLPLDAFYVGLVLNASYTYHFTDFWAWEIAGGGYTINIDSGLETELFDEFGVRPVQGGGERIRVLGATSVVIKPLFGKLALWNEDIVFSETSLQLGLGPALSVSANGAQEFWRPTVVAGLSFRFWSNEFLSVRFDVRDYVIFKLPQIENALMFLISASVNVATDDLEAENAAKSRAGESR